MQLEAPSSALSPGTVMSGTCLLVTSAGEWLSFFVTALLEWAELLGELGCACGWDPADLPWLTRSCSGVCWKCRGVCGRCVSCSQLVWQRDQPWVWFCSVSAGAWGEETTAPAKHRREGDSAFASKSQCWFLILHFLCPWVLWLIRNPPGSLPCLFTPLSILCLDCWLLMLAQALWSRGKCYGQAWKMCAPTQIVWGVCRQCGRQGAEGMHSS